MSQNLDAGDKHRAPAINFDTWLTRAQGILVVAGSLLAVFYVVANAAYAYFYESLGVRPEEVGVDQTSILARSVALIPIAWLMGYFAWLGVETRTIQKLLSRLWYVWILLSIALFVGGFLISTWCFVWSTLIGMVFCISQMIANRENVKEAATFLGFAILALLLAGIFALKLSIEWRIGVAKAGGPVGPVAWSYQPHLPVVDIHVTRARVLWVDVDSERPRPLDDPYLLYLGRGARGDVFLSCGHVFTVPPDKLVIENGFFEKRGEVSTDKRREFCRQG